MALNQFLLLQELEFEVRDKGGTRVVLPIFTLSKGSAMYSLASGLKKTMLRRQPMVLFLFSLFFFPQFLNFVVCSFASSYYPQPFHAFMYLHLGREGYLHVCHLTLVIFYLNCISITFRSFRFMFRFKFGIQDSFFTNCKKFKKKFKGKRKLTSNEDYLGKIVLISLSYF